MSTGWRMHLQLVCSSSPTSANSTSPHITFATEPILSTLDIYDSTHSIIIVLCLTMLASSLASPTTSNCIKEPLLLTDIHGEGTTAGEESIASKLFGERIGRAHAVFASRFGKWIIVNAVVCEVVNNVPGIQGGEARYWVATSAHLILCYTWGLVLHAPTLKRLAKAAGSWYFFLKEHCNLAPSRQACL